MPCVQGAQTDCTLDTDISSQLATSYMRQQCSPGYYGPLCSMCVKDDAQVYGRTSTWGCQKCKRHIAIVAAFAASNLLVLAFLWYSIHATLKDNEEDLSSTGSKVKVSELAWVCLPHKLTCCFSPWCLEAMISMQHGH